MIVALPAKPPPETADDAIEDEADFGSEHGEETAAAS